MDKSFIDSKQNEQCIAPSGNGISLILSVLCCICVSFTLLNMSMRLYEREVQHDRASEFAVAVSRQLESEAVADFLSFDEYEEIY